MAERGERARLVEEALLAPAEGLGGVGRARADGLVAAARRDVARQVLLQRDLEVQVRVGGEVGQPEAAHPEELVDAVLLQAVARRKGLRRHEGLISLSARLPSR